MKKICAQYQMSTPVSFASALANQAGDSNKKYLEVKNGRIVKAALNAAHLVYETEDESRFRIEFKGLTLIVSYHDECSTMNVMGFSDINMPESKWVKAYELINKLNAEVQAQCFMDSDGDLKACHIVDTDNTRLSEKMVHASISRVMHALREGREQLMRLRFT